MSAWYITCTNKHRQLCACKILFVWQQSFIVKSSGQNIVTHEHNQPTTNTQGENIITSLSRVKNDKAKFLLYLLTGRYNFKQLPDQHWQIKLQKHQKKWEYVNKIFISLQWRPSSNVNTGNAAPWFQHMFQRANLRTPFKNEWRLRLREKRVQEYLPKIKHYLRSENKANAKIRCWGITKYYDIYKYICINGNWNNEKSCAI